MTAKDLKGLIKAHLPGARVFVTDPRGSGDHFEAVVIAPQFKGLSQLDQHRLVYEACEGHMSKDIHALQIQPHNPDDWASH